MILEIIMQLADHNIGAFATAPASSQRKFIWQGMASQYTPNNAHFQTTHTSWVLGSRWGPVAVDSVPVKPKGKVLKYCAHVYSYVIFKCC